MATRKETKLSMVNIIKQKVEQAAGSGLVFMKVKDKEKKRVRFLTDLDDSIQVTFHDNFKLGVGNPCYKYFGRKACPFCGKDKSEGYRTRDLFIFSVYDYESKEIKLMMEAANDCSPIPAMLDFYETHGTICDRDYIISRRGKMIDTSYTLIPGDKKRFKGDGTFEALSEDEIFEKLKERYLTKMKNILQKIEDGTFGAEEDLDNDDEPKQKSQKLKNLKKKKSKSKKPEIDEELFDDDDEDEEEEVPRNKKKKSKPIQKAKKSRKIIDDEEDEEDFDDDDYEDEDDD